ncbi:MAG: hypothetical protein AABY22_16060 [Nanoarchaeota archaeon]
MKLKTLPIKPKNIFQSFDWLYNANVPETWKDFIATANYWSQELVQD